MSFGKFRDTKDSVDATSAGDSSKVQGVPKSTQALGAGKEGAYLASGSKVEGKLFFNGAAELAGEVEGQIESEGVLVIAQTAKINAAVRGRDITIEGTVKGNILASERIALKRPAQVQGDISSPVLSIEEGVIFQGSCKMTAVADKAGEKLAVANEEN